MVNQFNNPLTNPRGFFSSQPGGFFAPPRREGFSGFLSDPRVNIGLSIAQGQPLGQALLGGALQAKQIEESLFPEDERNLKVINNQVIDLTDPDNPKNLGNFGTAEKVKYEKAIVNDPSASNFGETIFVNNQNFGESISVDGNEIPKYLPVLTTEGSEPKDYFDKTKGTIVTIPQSVASTDRARYVDVTEDVRDAVFADPDGTLTPNEILKLGTKFQLYNNTTGKNIKVISENEYNAEVAADPTYAERFSLAPLGTGKSDILTGGFSDIYNTSKENSQKTIQTASNVTLKINDLITNIAENPTAAVKGVGPLAQITTNIRSFSEALGLANADTYKEFEENFSYISTSPSEKDWQNDVLRVSAQFGINESIVRDTAYALAAARGQEGRGLSDKDWENALKILSGGVNASEKIAILKNVADRLKAETIKNLSNTRNFLKLEDPSEETESLIRYYDRILDPNNASGIETFLPTINLDNIITQNSLPILEGEDVLNNFTPELEPLSANDILQDFSL